MAEEVINYQCPLCTGPLQFNAGTGKLECEYCGQTFSEEVVERLYELDGDPDAQMQVMMDAEYEQESNEIETMSEDEETTSASDWDLSNVGDAWGEDADHVRVYHCPSCGAELICEQTTAATACPYCDNPAIIPGQLSGELKPNYIIPFKLDKNQAIAALKKHYLKRPLLPKAFKTDNHLEEIKGVYVPFWLFDGKADGRMVFNASRSHTYQDGDYEVTETEHYKLIREGEIAFEHIPVDGSRKMPDDYMDSLEPFNYEEMVDFSTAFLPGYLADKYDVTAEESCGRADERASSTLASSLQRTVSGYSQVSVQQKSTRLYRDKVTYALLPVWLLRTKWEDKEYLFAMNGQTGKLVGDLPIDPKKKRIAFWAVYIPFFLIMALLLKNGLFYLFTL